MSLAGAFGASFLAVGLRASQTLNVVHGRRAQAAMTSFAIAAFDAGVVWSIARADSWQVILAVGAGGALGSVGVIELQRRRRVRDEQQAA